MIGKNIRSVRKQQGLSINKLSELSGVSLGYLSDLENGKMSNPSDNTIEAISEVLNVSSDYLQGRSICFIINERLETIKMPLSELCEKTGLSEKYYQNLDSMIPTPYDYERLAGIAEVLGMAQGSLIAALALQEPPLMSDDDYEVIDASEVFVKEDTGAYATSEELANLGLGYRNFINNTLKNRETLAAFRVDGYDEILTEDEAVAVKTFLETYRKMNGKQE